MNITVEIPGVVSEALHLSPAETGRRLQLELAVAFYAQGVLSHGKAAELAGLDWFDFNEALAVRHQPLPYTERELAEDIAYARRGQ